MKRLIISILVITGISLGQVPFGGGGNNGGGGGSVGPSANAHNNTTQTISSNTTTQLTFNTNDWDTCSSCTIHSTSTNPTRFTAPSAGFYLVQCSVAATAGTVDIFGNFLVNGSTPSPRISTTNTPSNANVGAMTITGIAKLNANDYVECSVFSISGFTSTANGSSMQMTKLSTTF